MLTYVLEPSLPRPGLRSGSATSAEPRDRDRTGVSGLTGNLVRSLMEDRVLMLAAVFDTPQRCKLIGKDLQSAP